MGGDLLGQPQKGPCPQAHPQCLLFSVQKWKWSQPAKEKRGKRKMAQGLPPSRKRGCIWITGSLLRRTKSLRAQTLGRSLAWRARPCARAPTGIALSPRLTAPSSTSARCGPWAVPALSLQGPRSPSRPLPAAPAGLRKGVHAHGELQAAHPHPHGRETFLMPGVQQGFLGPRSVQGSREDTQVPNLSPPDWAPVRGPPCERPFLSPSTFCPAAR